MLLLTVQHQQLLAADVGVVAVAVVDTVVACV